MVFLAVFGVEVPQKELSKEIIRLDSIDYKKIELILPLVDGCHLKKYLPCNPSICKIKNGYIVLCRTLNYELYIDGNRIEYNKCSPIKTKNIAVFYDKDFNKVKQTPIMDYVPVNYFKQIGPEDCRIFKWNDEYWFVGTTYDTSMYGEMRALLGSLKNVEDGDIIEFDKLISLASPGQAIHEKNWLPWIMNDKLLMVYSYDPFTILEVEKNGSYKIIINQNQAFNLSQFRGSAAPIPFKDGYLLMVHEVISPRIWPFTTDMRYYHRFIYLDSELKINKISNCLTFKNEIIEYVCGMTLDHSKQKIILGLGVWDREAYLGFMDAEYVWSLLNDI